ncbi:hypothetical protein DP939_05465 [Spongiactinospora rosea]|uniref:Uncharacterized protein n=2 Tax=Spongiactinospora rosea TaxID=2248750 RepID=A0A366M7H0_9ACTN|nr:hypothetical protein DP939_05465 [Spongiactinospora rosea]
MAGPPAGEGGTGTPPVIQGHVEPPGAPPPMFGASGGISSNASVAPPPGDLPPPPWASAPWEPPPAARHGSVPADGPTPPDGFRPRRESPAGPMGDGPRPEEHTLRLSGEDPASGAIRPTGDGPTPPGAQRPMPDGPVPAAAEGRPFPGGPVPIGEDPTPPGGPWPPGAHRPVPGGSVPTGPEPFPGGEDPASGPYRPMPGGDGTMALDTFRQPGPVPGGPVPGGPPFQGPGEAEPRSLFTPGGQPPGAQVPTTTGPAPGAPKRKMTLIIVGAVVALAVVVGAGFFLLRSPSGTPSAGGDDVLATNQPTGEPSPSEPAGEAGGNSILNAEATDPQKLSLAEAFPEKKAEFNGVAYTRVKTDITDKCAKAAIGKFAEALTGNKCARVVRATYVDGKKRHAITTGIAVFPTREDALAADKAKNLGTNVWFRALPGGSGSGAERVHIAGGYASGLVWGRYIVFSYATNADGHTPTAKEKGLGEVSGAFRDNTALVLERRITG